MADQSSRILCSDICFHEKWDTKFRKKYRKQSARSVTICDGVGTQVRIMCLCYSMTPGIQKEGIRRWSFVIGGCFG